MNYTRADIINALCAEWDYLCHDDFDPENDQTTEEYREELQNYSLERVSRRNCTGEGYTLDEFMKTGNSVPVNQTVHHSPHGSQSRVY